MVFLETPQHVCNGRAANPPQPQPAPKFPGKAPVAALRSRYGQAKAAFAAALFLARTRPASRCFARLRFASERLRFIAFTLLATC